MILIHFTWNKLPLRTILKFGKTTNWRSYADSQISLNDLVSSHWNISNVWGEPKGTYRFITGFCSLTDMHKYFQKAMESTLQNTKEVICSPDDMPIVSTAQKKITRKLLKKLFTNIEKEGLALKLSSCEFTVNEILWLSFDTDESCYQFKLPKL